MMPFCKFVALTGAFTALGAMAFGQDAAELERRAEGETRYLLGRIQQERGVNDEFIASRIQEHDGFVKDDAVALVTAVEREVAWLEREIEAWKRRDETEARRLRTEADNAGRRREVWRNRLGEWRDKQHDAWPIERWYTWESRIAQGESLAALNELVRAKRAAADAWGKLAEATVPGAERELLDPLHDAALTAEKRREMAQWKFQWATRRQEFFGGKEFTSPELEAALAEWDKAHAERLKIREAEIERDQRVRELQRIEKRAEREIELAAEAAVEPDEKRRWKKRTYVELTADDSIKPAQPLPPLTTALPEGWRNADIGAVRWPGSVIGTSNTFTIRASGWGAWGPDDAFHFAYQELDGDGQIIARLAGVDESHGKLAASVMIRESLAADAPFAGATIHPSGQVRLSRRFPTNAPQFTPSENVTSHPKWMRLARRGDVFTAYSSMDGKFWQQVESRTIAMPARALIGVAAWTIANVSRGEVKLDSVQVARGTPSHTFFADADLFEQGIVCRDGVKLPGAVRVADTNGVTLAREGREEFVSWSRIARLLFNAAPADFAKQRTPGVLLTTGEFLEGDLAEVRETDAEEKRKRSLLVMRTLLFGERTFDAQRDVIGVVIDPRK